MANAWQNPDSYSPCSLKTTDLPNGAVLLDDGLQSNNEGAAASDVLGAVLGDGVVGISQGLVGARGCPANVVVEVVVQGTNNRSAPLSIAQNIS